MALPRDQLAQDEVADLALQNRQRGDVFGEPALLGLEELLVELLGNLLDNALRHTPGGGTIQIDLAELPNGDAGVAVVDGGPGIPREYAQIIFERFVQVPGSKTGTTGLGLSLAAEIARLHGGRLVLANPGQPGARFECRLPRARS